MLKKMYNKNKKKLIAIKKLTLKFLILASLILSLPIAVPSIYRKVLKNYVTGKLVYVVDINMGRGGTGFHVKGKSGKTYIMTNSHVCDGVGKNGNIFILTENSSLPVQRRIIENSVYTDLCLIEPIEGIEGLSLSSGVSTGDIVHSIGHPSLYPSTMNSGEIITETFITIPVSFDTENCNLPKNKIVKARTFFGEMEMCAISVRSYLTNIESLPGNSGSPVVNSYGNVVAVLFAGRNDNHWAILVSLKEIKTMLETR